MSAKSYHILFSGALPERIEKGVLVKNRIHFRADTLHFESRQIMMETFDNPDRLVAHLKTSGVFKMMMDNYERKLSFEPTIICTPYFEAISGSKMWYDEIREIDIGIKRETKIITN